MKKCTLPVLLLFCMFIQFADASGIEDLPCPVTIRSDGSIHSPDMGHLRLERNGSHYYVTDDNNDFIIVKRDNITIDGNGYSLVSPPRAYGRVALNLTNRSNVTVHNVTLASVWVGTKIHASNNVTLSNVNVKNSRYAIRISDSKHVRIYDCSITDNDDEAIKILNSIECTVYANSILTCESGVFIENSIGNNITENRISRNRDGVVVIESGNNTIQGNNITFNREVGIWVYHSNSNLFHHNNFIDNMEQVVSIQSWNSWEHNYWSDYQGVDSDDDGLGEQPYVIDMNNQDPNPRINVIPEFPTVIMLPSLIFISALICLLARFV